MKRETLLEGVGEVTEFLKDIMNIDGEYIESVGWEKLIDQLTDRAKSILSTFKVSAVHYALEELGRYKDADNAKVANSAKYVSHRRTP